MEKVILVVDDVAENLTMMSGILKDYWKVKVSITGAKAIDIANKNPQPSLILLDVNMPFMDGFEVCRKLKEKPETAHIPILFLTAMDDPHSVQTGLDMGAQGYLTKPIDFNALFEKVRFYLNEESA